MVFFKPSDPTTRSLIITPILFGDRYYGNLRLGHENTNHFQTNNILFFEGLAYQLAITLYRLETVRERQELLQRAMIAEATDAMGRASFGLTHYLGNSLGLVQTRIRRIRAELKTLEVKSKGIAEELENIAQAVGKVLFLNRKLKDDWRKLGEASSSEWVVIHPQVLLEEASKVITLPANIRLETRRAKAGVSKVRVMHSLVIDTLLNLITNAIEVMPKGGQITLQAYNSGQSVVLEISDTGPGIPKRLQSKIFDMFFSTKKSTGYGLWAARRNAISHHGELIVRCESGQRGTTFSLSLPKVVEE